MSDAPLLLEAQAAARARFGYAALRPHQKEVLAHVLGGRDCVAVLPTGGGKSLCYALPALVRPGLVLVVSPLIALIRDQVRRCRELGIRAASVDSHQGGAERDEVWAALARRELQLLFVSPERLARNDFRDRLRGAPLQLLAVDEAHCISHWGSHFRPDYRVLGERRRELGPVQTLALTATATAQVLGDITASLGLVEPATVFGEVARENLKLKVVRADKVAEHRTAVLQAVLNGEGSGIVYAPTRKNVHEVHRMLADAGVAAVPYHAGMAPDARQASQQAFMSGKARVVVATHAFGLGIDKADIRFVHHAGLPGSLEQYVQEIGRAGRDGAPAQCWLVYGSRDYHIQKFMLDKSYPDVDLLEATLAAARHCLAAGGVQSEAALLRHVRGATASDDDATRAAVEVLCREGILSRLRAAGRGFDRGFEETLIEEGVESADQVLADYPLRKSQALAKLDAMRAYVGLAGPSVAYLEEYFRR